jgi:hypothetical protein
MAVTRMTAAELIEILQKVPPDTRVQVYDSQGIDRDVEGWTSELNDQGSRIVLNREQFYS